MMRTRSFKIVGIALLILSMFAILLSQFANIIVTREVRLTGAREMLMNAIYDGSPVSEIRSLLNSYPTWAREPIYEGWYAVHCAGQAGRPEVLQLLLDHGADINQLGPDGANVIISALDSQNASTLAFVLDHGADPNIVMSDGSTPLEYVRQHGGPELQKVLDDRGLPESSP